MDTRSTRRQAQGPAPEAEPTEMDAQVAALEAQLQAQQVLLQNQANQAAQQAAQLAALLQVQQQAIVPGPFALTPAQAQQNVVDLTTSTG